MVGNTKCRMLCFLPCVSLQQMAHVQQQDSLPSEHSSTAVSDPLRKFGHVVSAATSKLHSGTPVMRTPFRMRKWLQGCPHFRGKFH